MKEKILIVEDDLDLVRAICDQLEELEYLVDSTEDGNEALEYVSASHYCLVLLDLHVRGLEGVEVCREIRAVNAGVPIIVISSKSDEVNKVLLLELGADDYLVKPFGLAELKARIKTVLRRSRRVTSSSSHYRYRDLVLDFERRTVVLAEKKIELTASEFDILAAMAERPGRPFSRDELNEVLYGHPVSGYEHSVNTHVNRMRGKLEKDRAKPIYLLTIRGVGYCVPDPSDS